MPVITISRQFGSGGSLVAEQVARELGWRLYDNEVVDSVAQRLGMTTEEVSAREERPASLAERLASAMSLATPVVTPALGDVQIPTSEDRIVAMTERVMEEAVARGPAVIVGRGAQCLLALRSDALHVFCYAPMEALVARAAERLGVSPDEARKKVIETNLHREQFVKRHWHREWRAVSNYHLCLNTAWLGLDGAARLVIESARRHFG